MTRKIQKALFIGAHPDDIELGCGGTIAKFIERDIEPYCLVATRGGTAAFGHDRVQETATALNTLGVPMENIVQHDFPDARLDSVPLFELIRCIENTVASIKPDRVYTMFREDRHQDHRAVFHASDVACRKVPQILVYETPSAYPNFVPTFFEALSPAQIQLKKTALAAHVSQGERIYMDHEAITAACKFRATQVGLNQCEGFIAHKFIF
ncbi:PIG-L deacetylase family protein [Solilutibacter pythonis]|nr:PIG-L family deacetylase [Lysobacter pythonis]